MSTVQTSRILVSIAMNMQVGSRGLWQAPEPKKEARKWSREADDTEEEAC